MTVLVIGPTSAGKSTFIRHLQQQKIIPASTASIIFGKDLIGQNLKENQVIHYNLLHYLTYPNASGLADNFNKEPIFEHLVQSQIISLAYVIVAPVKELLERCSERSFVEENCDELYDNTLWLDRLQNIDFFKLYEDLYDIFESHGIRYQVIYSSRNVEDSFLKSDRVYSHHNLKGQYFSPPSVDSVKKLSIDNSFKYQPVLLPYGVRTKTGQYAHLSSSRKNSFDYILRENLCGQSVLDIGSAMGSCYFLPRDLGQKNWWG